MCQVRTSHKIHLLRVDELRPSRIIMETKTSSLTLFYTGYLTHEFYEWEAKMPP